MIVRLAPKRLFINQYGFFSYLKGQTQARKFLYLLDQADSVIEDDEINSIQIFEKSCYRLKDNFSKLKYNEQLNTIKTERCILFLQYYLDYHQITENCVGSQYQETFDRLCYLESLFQANERLKLPILEILNNIQVEVVEKIKDVRQKILDTEVVI